MKYNDNMFTTFFQKIKEVPAWGWIYSSIIFCLQYLMYLMADQLSRLTGMTEHAFTPNTMYIDNLIPVISSSSFIYLFAYVFWIFGTAAVSLTGKKNFLNYIIGLGLAYFIGALIFFLFPTYLNRSAAGLLTISSKPGFFNWMLNVIYKYDGGVTAYNLFPSYHCLTSIYCYLGVRKQPMISNTYKVFSLIMTFLICLSALFTKQHFILDVVGGLILSILCYTIIEKINPASKSYY